ncbi:response regulator [Devosia chinhatensis]|uniref:Response regulatory domain-containing protein n=1 Tax=Devosia chinhatensis TaxID=429727 RepID=A0A0F5FGG7_9HYPH|nr:response regulator [Devosia chinhatensis]KKB07287.1 hypothetical protein VE26_10835 [Devosia chinhatensis]
MSPDPVKRAFLVVDDEPFVRMDLAELVRECGLEAYEAGSTSEALAVLERAAESFSGLITDVNMPGSRSGFVLANHVRVVWPHIRIIVVSAGRKPLTGELPADTAFIAKPWNQDALSAAIGGI